MNGDASRIVWYETEIDRLVTLSDFDNASDKIYVQRVTYNILQ